MQETKIRDHKKTLATNKLATQTKEAKLPVSSTRNPHLATGAQLLNNRQPHINPQRATRNPQQEQSSFTPATSNKNSVVRSSPTQKACTFGNRFLQGKQSYKPSKL